MSTERAHSLCSASFLPALLRPAPAACRGPSSGRTEARLSTHSVFGRPSKGLVCQEASAPCSRAAASLTAGVTRAEEPLQVTGAAGRAGQQPPQLPLGANRHLPAGLAWLRCYLTPGGSVTISAAARRIPRFGDLGRGQSGDSWPAHGALPRRPAGAAHCRALRHPRNSALPFAAGSAGIQTYPGWNTRVIPSNEN